VKTKILKSILFIGIVLGTIFYYHQTRPQFQVFSGETMNTYYRILIRSSNENTLLHNEIKNELQMINNELSVFENSSDISLFNKNDNTGWIDVPDSLAVVLKEAYRVYLQTNGYFDPSVGKLVDIWGFGRNKNIRIPNDDEIKTTQKDVGLKQISFSNDFRRARKKNPNIQLNLSAIAKGYAVDRLSSLLEKYGYKNFIVEIGGEVRAKGNRSKTEQGWNVGVARPENNKVDVYEYVVKLKNMSAATSGDYRNYFYIDDKRYSHTIDPKTGYPTDHKLASVTVFDEDCMRADALATGIMSMGEKRGLEFANSQNLSVIMFVRKDNDFQVISSNKAQKMLKAQQKEQKQDD